MKMRLQSVTLWLALVSLVGSSWIGCETVPETGRHQLNLISADQEMQLGLASFDQTKKDVPISRDAAANALLQRVGSRIAASVKTRLPNAQWEFVLFESKEANAFCLPGGKVGVYTGILPITKDEAGLATVLGHEIAHATAHHGSERMSEQMVVQGLGSALGAGVNAYNPKLTALTMQVYGAGAQVGRELPHSRAQEAEADEIGLYYMAQAGFPPEAAVAFWERFSAYINAQGGNSTPGFLRTHPLDADRIAHLKTLLPKAKALYHPQ